MNGYSTHKIKYILIKLTLFHLYFSIIIYLNIEIIILCFLGGKKIKKNYYLNYYMYAQFNQLKNILIFQQGNSVESECKKRITTVDITF